MSITENLQSLMQAPVFVSGGGRAKSPWDISWDDAPFAARDETVLAPWTAAKELKALWQDGTPPEESALYIHIPFCRLSCTYCAFFKKKANEEAQHRYAMQLCKEMDALQGRPYIEKCHFRAVFFGGGTPGILSAADISAILAKIHDVFPLAKDAEITMESSLSDMTEDKLDAAIEGGVNRFSFGVQSFQTAIRNSIGRPLPREKALETFQHFAKKKALMILDLIYGLPGETEKTMAADIRDAKAAGAAGLDLYQLHLLPGSPLAESFKKTGRTLEREYLQSLFRAAESELQGSGATNISCTHWKWNPKEKSLYNTLSSGHSDTLPIGMACGGRLSHLSLMKPMAETMYQGAIRMGAFLPMGVKRQSAFRSAYSTLAGAADRGFIDPAALENICALPLTAMLAPLLETWRAWGLVAQEGSAYRYTSAGRYWHRVLLRRLMHSLDYLLWGAPDPAKAPKHWSGMMNMK